VKNSLYPECDTCKDLSNCPHPEIAQDMLGTPMPPEGCPRPIAVMKATVKKQNKDK